MTNEERENYCYIGDGVYAFFNGFGIWLRTGNHEDEKCDDKIYLEPCVLNSLNSFNRRMSKQINSTSVHEFKEEDPNKFTQEQIEHICYQISDWYLMMKPLLEGTHNLGYMKERLKTMICGE